MVETDTLTLASKLQGVDLTGVNLPLGIATGITECPVQVLTNPLVEPKLSATHGVVGALRGRKG